MECCCLELILGEDANLVGIFVDERGNGLHSTDVKELLTQGSYLWEFP